MFGEKQHTFCEAIFLWNARGVLYEKVSRLTAYGAAHGTLNADTFVGIDQVPKERSGLTLHENKSFLSKRRCDSGNEEI